MLERGRPEYILLCHIKYIQLIYLFQTHCCKKLLTFLLCKYFFLLELDDPMVIKDGHCRFFFIFFLKNKNLTN